MSRSLNNALTVRELIEELECMDPNAKVVFAYNYGDHGNTTVCAEAANVDEVVVKYSEYHRLHTIVEDRTTEELEDGQEAVVVIQ